MEKPAILGVGQQAQATWCAANGNAVFLLAGGGGFVAGTFAAVACNIPALAIVKLGGAAA